MPLFLFLLRTRIKSTQKLQPHDLFVSIADDYASINVAKDLEYHAGSTQWTCRHYRQLFTPKNSYGTGIHGDGVPLTMRMSSKLCWRNFRGQVFEDRARIENLRR